jgi:hypothetical protein
VPRHVELSSDDPEGSLFSAGVHDVVLGPIPDCLERQEPGQSGGYDCKCPNYVDEVGHGRKGAVDRRRETVENKKHHKRAAERKIKMSQEGLYDVHLYRDIPRNPAVNPVLDRRSVLSRPDESSGNTMIIRGIIPANRTVRLNQQDSSSEPRRQRTGTEASFN